LPPRKRMNSTGKDNNNIWRWVKKMTIRAGKIVLVKRVKGQKQNFSREWEERKREVRIFHIRIFGEKDKKPRAFGLWNRPELLSLSLSLSLSPTFGHILDGYIIILYVVEEEWRITLLKASLPSCVKWIEYFVLAIILLVRLSRILLDARKYTILTLFLPDSDRQSIVVCIHFFSLLQGKFIGFIMPSKHAGTER